MMQVCTNQASIQGTYNKPGQLATDFTKYDAEKSTLISRVEEYAGWTLPGEFPASYTQNDEQQRDFQSIGAKAVNHLSNKLVFTLFSTTRPFFRLDVDDDYMDELEETIGLKPADVQMALSREERKSVKRLSKRGMRVALNAVMNQLIIAGNALLYLPISGGNAQVFTLRDYVCKRDLSGNVLDIITREMKSMQTLPDDVKEALVASSTSYHDPDTDVVLYTRIRRICNKFYIMQSADNVPVASSYSEIPEKQLPWIPLTWKLNRGFDYGTGLVEDYAGDFHSLSVMSESMVIGAALAAEIKFLVDPTGNTDTTAMNAARNGDFVAGRVDDISVLQIDKRADWAFVLEMISTYERRIGQAFLLGSAVTRDAERVTAEEIRFQAQELETSLGGVYSRLSEDLQLKLAYLALGDTSVVIAADKRIEPIIITGMESLSRNSDVDNMMLYFQDLSLLAQLPENVQEYIKVPEIMAMFGTARSVDYTQFMKDEKQVSEERAQNAQQQIELQNQLEQGKAAALQQGQ